MATRIYTKVSGAVGVTPSTWNFAIQASPVTVPGTLTPNDGSVMTSKTENTGTGNPEVRAFGRTIIGPLAGQSIAGTISGQMRAAQNNNGASCTLALAVKIVQPDGTDRAVLLAQTASDAATSAPHEFITNTLTNRQFANVAEATAVGLTTQSATAGDWLVIEWGCRSATTVDRTATLSYGNDNAADLTAGNTSETTALNPWWEFSQTLTFNFPLLVSVTDALAVADAVTVLGLTIPLAVTDAVSVGDTPILAPIAQPLALSVTDPVTLSETLVSHMRGLANTANAVVSFSNAQTIALPGAAHGFGTAALLIQGYDAATPRAQIALGSVTVHPSTFDILVTLAQVESGILVLSSALGTGAQGNVAVPFSTAQTVTILGATHGLGTPYLLVQVYDGTTPLAAQLQPGAVTIDQGSLEVVVTFRQNQSGFVVLSGYANYGTPALISQGFTNVGSVSVPLATHALDTKNMVVQVYDAATPAALLEGGSVTVNTTTYEVVVTFRQNQSGTVVLSGAAAVIAAPVVGSLALTGVGL